MNGLDTAIARLTAIAEDSKRKRVELDQWLATQPPYTMCQRHNVRMDIDHDESSRQSHYYHKNVAAYHDCPDCTSEALKAVACAQFRDMGIPIKYLGVTLDDLTFRSMQGKVNLEHCRQYANNPRGFLVLLGAKGNGKTHIAAAILQRYGRGIFITQSTLLNMHRETYHNCLACNIRRKCMSAGMLVLDEAGLSVGGRDEEPLVYDILNERYAQKRPTVITANMDATGLGIALGDRILDRLREAAYQMLYFNEPSKRAEAHDQYIGDMGL